MAYVDEVLRGGPVNLAAWYLCVTHQLLAKAAKDAPPERDKVWEPIPRPLLKVLARLVSESADQRIMT